MEQEKNNRLLTVLIVIVSLSAIIYFGLQAVSENVNRQTDNPFEYNIENYKKSDSTLTTYVELEKIPISYENYFGITINEKDDIFLSVDNQIVVFDKEKSEKLKIELSESAYCLESDKEGNLYAGMADHIEVFSYDGKNISKWESLGGKAIITSIAVTKDYVYAADAGNLVVWQFDLSGNIISEIGKKNEQKDIPGFILPSPYFDVDIDPDGLLWVANAGRHSLENYTDDGSIRTSWGIASMRTEGFSGCCNPSHFVILDDGSFVTSEKGIVRIKVYDYHGKLTDIVATPKEFDEGTVDLDLAIDSHQKIYVLDESKKAIRIFEKNK